MTVNIYYTSDLKFVHIVNKNNTKITAEKDFH